ncbi:MAG: alpha/beta fold hydrolase [Pseudomonadales bacterium]
MKLNYQSTGAGEVVILMHGVFGSLSNLASVGRALATDYRVLAVDLRNHGLSAHDEVMNYQVMAADIVDLMDDLSVDKAYLLGHSMGGKVGMQIALNYPSRVSGLIVGDIAPVTYAASHDVVIDGLRALVDASLESRKQANEILSGFVKEEGVRGFLLKNLYRTEGGSFSLRLNLDAVEASYYDYLSLAPVGTPYSGPVLFIKGENSAYIQEKHREAVSALFPQAELKIISDTGHWLHAEKPDSFNRLVGQFLKQA